MRLLRIRLTWCLIVACLYTQAQQPQTIRFRKDERQLIFFKLGRKTDTIPDNSRFYLFISDTLQPYIDIEVYNGRLDLQVRDTIFALEYITGIRYLCDFPRKGKNFIFRTVVDGSSDMPAREMLIRIVDRRDEELLLENRYYIKP